MSQGHDTIAITIDNKTINARVGATILEVAQENEVYIPTLCAHKDLTPFGGCRMCIVEVEGMRGLPTACTTPVSEGMIVRTHTSQVHSVRKEILQLILSEHTCSCLICEEAEECKAYSTTIRKTGVTTGCRWCPNDSQCELQDVALRMDLKEIGYPIAYRGLPVEQDDPFYDRDYNLCILCGRCVRVCQEVRAAGTLAFNQRGQHSIVGPAFGRSHMDAGCEFCGACVELCPTGSLAEKASKWEGKPDGEQETTCAFCGVGCQIRLLTKRGTVISSRPVDDPLVNQGQLCVKGRFCVSELVSNPERLAAPYEKAGQIDAEISWDEAIDRAAEKLSACAPDDFAMMVSPNCTNEDLYVAQKFARVAMRSNNLDTSARAFYGRAANAYLSLMNRSVPLSDLKQSKGILCVGLDTRFGRSVVGVALRKAIRAKARVATINPQEHALGIIGDTWIRPAPGKEAGVLSSLLERVKEKKEGTFKTQGDRGTVNGLESRLNRAADILLDADKPLILMGSEALHQQGSETALERIRELAELTGAGVLPLPAQNNFVGSVLMGCYPEFLPGGASSRDQKQVAALARAWGVEEGALPSFSSSTPSSEQKKVVYLVGETQSSQLGGGNYMIFQNILPPPDSCEAQLVLPAASFTEVDGSTFNGEGRLQQVNKAVEPPGVALPDWQILCRIATKMGVKGFDFEDLAALRKEIASVVPRFEGFGDGTREAAAMNFQGELTLDGSTSASGDHASHLWTSMEHSHRGFPLSAWVDGARRIFPDAPQT